MTRLLFAAALAWAPAARANPPAPTLGPDGNPVPPEAMAAIFPGPIIEHEKTAERCIAITEQDRQMGPVERHSPQQRRDERSEVSR